LTPTRAGRDERVDRFLKNVVFKPAGFVGFQTVVDNGAIFDVPGSMDLPGF
jgi:hypothetical protein